MASDPRREPGPLLQSRALLLTAALVLGLPGSSGAVSHPRLGEGDPCATKTCHPAYAKSPVGTRSVHEPVLAGECRACHDLDLAAGPPFVRGFPADQTSSGRRGVKVWDAVLCGGCHEDQRLAPVSGPASTGFRDGEENLHDVHIAAGGKGRVCLTCHDPHAASQLHLLRAEIAASGTLKIRQQFRELPSGGRCRTGCHAPKIYNRE